MSINAMLVKYKNSKERLNEKDAHNLKSCIIPEEIYIFIQRENLEKNIKILEEDSNEEIDISILEIDSLNKIFMKIKKSIKDKSKLLCSDELSNKEEDVTFNELKQLLDLRSLCLEKIERYSDKNHILIQIG